ncbi:MAG: hypothetical protein EA400_02395 [Chromatiaceae bacterium]|nr:MAG: hypothetical protein EA400_02395 [Chromatiaceae bacterium]
MVLEQVQAFGAVGWDPRERVISIAYLGLLPAARRSEICAGDDAVAAAWFALAELPPLAFDLGEIIGCARRRLLSRLAHGPDLALRSRPPSFTLAELQEIDEGLLGRALVHDDAPRWARALAAVEPAGSPAAADHGRPRSRRRAAGLAGRTDG